MTKELSFASTLKKCRKAAGFTQEALAFAARLDRTYISFLERGLRTPTLATIEKLARALQIKASELIELSEDDFALHRSNVTSNHHKPDFMRNVLDSIAEAVIVADRDFNLLYFNQAAQRLHEMREKACASTEWAREYGIYLPDKITPCPHEEIPLVRVLRGELPEFVELYIKKSDGSGCAVESTGRPLLDSQGNIIGGVVVFSDISERQNIQVALHKAQLILKEAQKRAKIGFWERDLVTDNVTWSEGMYEIYDRHPDHPPPDLKNHTEIYTPESYQQLQQAMDRLLRDKTEVTMELEVLRPDGSTKWVMGHSRPVLDHEGNVIGLRGSALDISERRAAEEALELASVIYGESAEAILITDEFNRIISVNQAFTRFTGYQVEEIIGKNPKLLSSGLQEAGFYQAMWHALVATGRWQGEIKNRRKNGEVYDEWLTINTLYNKEGGVYRRIALFSDITQKKKNEALIWKQANFDALTGLPNRRMFRDRLDQDIRKSNRAHLPMALLFLDLDDFKEVNDTLGHDVGDQVLRETASRLSTCVRDTDTVARLGGDEFTVILGELDDISIVERVINEILMKLAEPFYLDLEVAYISASIGITLYPDDGTTADLLLKNADQAMYAAKDLGRNCFAYFTPTMQETALHHRKIANDLRGALHAGQFEVHYQPIVDLASGEVRKAEALIRWHHPRHESIGPATFIPIAEETGMINDIGNWVFRQSAEMVARCRQSHHPEFQISVNRSPIQFRHDGEHRKEGAWFDQLNALALPGQSIVVEITESLLMDTSNAVTDQLLGYRDQGIQVALDDFGTGYSSLSYLKKYHIDYLKIDQSFVRNLAPDSGDLALCEAIIVMAHKLGIKVIAEGVETAEQRDLLLQAGCDCGQGYLFSKALPADEFEQLLNHSRQQPGIFTA